LKPLFRQQVKVNCQTEKKAEIKYNKDTRKIKNKFIFLFSWNCYCYKVFYQGKPAVFGTALYRKPGFITENLINYRIQWFHYGGTCVWGSTTEAFVTLFWAALNLLYYRKQILTLNHKANDAIVSKIDHAF